MSSTTTLFCNKFLENFTRKAFLTEKFFPMAVLSFFFCPQLDSLPILFMLNNALVNDCPILKETFLLFGPSIK